MKILRLGLLASLPFLLAAADKVEKPKPRMEKPPAQFYIPNGGPRGERHYISGEYILDLPVLWERAGILAETVVIEGGGRTKVLAEGHPLQELRIVGVEGANGVLTAWCSAPQTTGTNGALAAQIGLLGRALMKSLTDGQYCVSDLDEDGAVDHSFVLNVGTEEQRVLQPITPVKINRVEGVPIAESDDRVRIRFKGTALGGSSPVFELEILEQGQKMKFDNVSSKFPNRVKTERLHTVSVKGGWPQRVDIFGAEFIVTGYDASTKTLAVTWPEGAELKPVVVPVETRFTTSYY